MLWTKLRQKLWHQLSRLMLAYDVGDLLSALPRNRTVEGGQGVFAGDLTFGYKVTTWNLRSPLNAARFSRRHQVDFGHFSRPRITEVTAAGGIVVGHFFNSIVWPVDTFVFQGGLVFSSRPPPDDAGHGRPIQARPPRAMVRAGQGVLPVEGCGVHLLVLSIVVRQLGPPVFPLRGKKNKIVRRLIANFYKAS